MVTDVRILHKSLLVGRHTPPPQAAARNDLRLIYLFIYYIYILSVLGLDVSWISFAVDRSSCGTRTSIVRVSVVSSRRRVACCLLMLYLLIPFTEDAGNGPESLGFSSIK